MRRVHAGLLAVVVLAVAAAVTGAALLWPTAAPAVDPSVAGDDVRLQAGTLTAIAQLEEADMAGLAPGARTLRLTAELADGREVEFEMVDETGDTFAVGQRVRVAEVGAPDGGTTFYVNDIERTRPLLLLTGVFLVAVLVFGRWQGLRALLGLALTLAVVVVYVVPAVLAGSDPTLVALSAAVLIMAITLYLTHGVRPKTTAAVVGTLAALGVTVGLSWLFIRLTALTGLSSEEARMASLQVGGLSLRGLLLAGIIIGALGVLDDVTMAQSSTVFELRRADPRAGFAALFSGGMAVGRDHVAATINTLFLAYVGASLPLLILFSGSPDPFPIIASSEIVAVEIVRTLVGSIGLMASVPVTTALAAWLAHARSAADAVEVAASEHVGAGRDRRRRPLRRRRTDEREASLLDENGDDGELDWERRLRASYGLHRGPDRRPPVSDDTA
ncbi:MAG: YibE/F family protein [Actinobacteria bacterium]|nr:YibE/F family protein [Actinomycetota bacterium]